MYPAPVRRPSVWWWFLIPGLSLGFGTFAGVFIAATRLKSRWVLYAAIGYLLVNVIFFGIALVTPTMPHTGLVATPGVAVSVAAYPFVAVNWIGGTIHTLCLQVLAARPEAIPADPVTTEADRRAAVRAEGRRLEETDPARARALMIGRPDLLGRTYDDGGLVDINHVPAGWIALGLRIPRPLADRIVAERERRGGFRTPEELVIYCAGMTPEILATIRDFLLFRPL